MSDAAATTDRPSRVQRRALLFAVVVLSAGLLGGKCEPSGLLPNPPLMANPESCTMLQSSPLALAFSSNTLWVATSTPPTMVPFIVDEIPPQMPPRPAPFVIPADSDGNGTADEDEPGELPPAIDDIIVVGISDLLLPTFNKEGVLFFTPSGVLGESEVSVPAEFDAADNPELPNPGVSRLQTGFSTKTCLDPPAGATDSEGEQPLDDCAAGSGFFSKMTSGVAVDSGRAFVTFENRTTTDSGVFYQPGVVAVYDFGTGISPHQMSESSSDITTIFTSGFSPSDIVVYTTMDVDDNPRRFALVAVSRASGLTTTPAAIDVIDIETDQLVATFPLGLVAISAAGIQIDAAGSVAVVGNPAARELYAVDLGVLGTESIPSSSSGGPLVLNSGVIFGGANPLTLDPSGEPDPDCPGSILGLGFNHAGTRLFATDNCDGSFIAIDFFPTETGENRFGAQAVTDFAAPRDNEGTRPRGIGRLAVRPEPLTRYDGPDVFVLIDEPEGMVCALFVDAPSP